MSLESSEKLRKQLVREVAELSAEDPYQNKFIQFHGLTKKRLQFE